MRKKTNTKRNSKPERSKEKIKSTNDPYWYASDPALLRDAASIPFSWSIGTTIPRGGEGTITFENEDGLPGILRLDVTPTMGLSTTNDSALNIAATSMYSFIRSANSGHANYDSPDLMLYCGAMSSVYAYINWCQRIYGLATMYAQQNRYLPKALLASMDIDPDDIIMNLANFRYWINVMVNKASSLCVPATLSFFSRRAFMYSNIYCEGESIKDQLYYFHPAAWYRFKLNTDSSGMLESVKLEPNQSKLSLYDIMSFGDSLLAPLVGDEDCNIMSGDILKAYGTGGIIQLASIPEYLPIIPLHDEMVLEQIHNATVLGVTDTNVTQDPTSGILSCVPSTTTATGILSATKNKILSVNKPDPGPEDVIESTRLMVGGDSSRSTSNSWMLGCGTEIATSCNIYTLKPDGSLSKSVYYSSFAPTSGATIASMAAHIGKLKYFKYAPGIDVCVDNKVVSHIESIDNYAVLTPTDIYRMHDVALMNMLAVPSIAKVSNVN